MSYVRTVLSLCMVVTGVSLAACAGETSDSAVEGDSQNLTECNATGTWAIKIATPVKWNASFVVQGGTGTIVNYVKSKRTQTGLNVADAAKLCGLETPPYLSTATFGNEKYGIQFQPAVFDSASMPTFNLAGTLSGTAEGATFTAAPGAALVGASLTNPTSDPWPATLTAVDADGDSNVGLTATPITADGFLHPPVNAQRSIRAGKVFAAFRQVIKASGTVKTCSRVEALGDIVTIGNKPAIDQHVLGCQHDDGTACTPAEFKLLDGAAPVYQPTGQAVVTMIKVPDTASCADVRGAAF